MTTAQTAIDSSQRVSVSNFMLSKIANPFTTKQSLQIRHEIELDEPFKQFGPGELVKGAVHLETTKPIRVTHLIVRLHGLVKVTSHSKLPGEPIPYDENLLYSTKGPRGGKQRGGEYFGDGFARLFEEEVILCGDGRIAGNYVFRFDVRLPSMGLPSSIDFENGTITYLVTSILTRPTTISPTSIRDYKLKLKEKIDIASIPLPVPQSISLETVARRRPVVQMKKKVSALPSGKDNSVAEEGEAIDSTSSEPSSAVEVPNSPAPSEISSTSIVSSSNSNTHYRNASQVAQEARSYTGSSLSSPGPDRTITAQTEILQGGCLPGDVLPIKVSIDHTKRMKSMQGVIITFYRLARIDTHPAIPLGPSSRRKYEDLYPKSRTGLGGLSLSSAGSSRTFRQDLAQNITPLMVDPQTLTAIIKTSVQIPDHIFPTINGVPGSMISFRYFIEIVVDLRGKLGQDRLLPKFSMTDTPQHAYGDAKVSMVDGRDGVTFSTTPGFNFLITDQIRRQKGIIHTKTEVIIGTTDSSRSKAKQKKSSSIAATERHMVNSALNINSQTSSLPTGDGTAHGEMHLHNQNNTEESATLRTATPLPDRSEEPLDEKAQIRRAEQTLLPSSPPQDPRSSLSASPPASAPLIYDEEDLDHRYQMYAPAPAYDGLSSTRIPFDYDNASTLSPLQTSTLVRRRTASPEDAPSEPPANASDDKQELERLRLQTLASSPNDYAEAEAAIQTSVPHQLQQILPSAPVLFEGNGVAIPTDQTVMTVSGTKEARQSTPTAYSIPSINPTPAPQQAEFIQSYQSTSLHANDTKSELQADTQDMSPLAASATQLMDSENSNALDISSNNTSNLEVWPDHGR